MVARQVPTSSAFPNPRPAARPERAPGSGMLRRHVDQVVSSTHFDGSRRTRELLRFLAGEALAGRAASLVESAIAARVFGRGDDFDAALDPIVRIHAGCLRRALERYYALPPKEDGVRIDLPRGALVPVFRVVAPARVRGRQS